MKKVKTNDIETTFEDGGSGLAILFLHGYPFNLTMWREQIDALKNQYRVIAPDLRGFGESTVAGEVAGMDQMARDMAALLDQLGIESAVICGLSMGGYVALDFSRLFPGRMRGLVLAGTRAPADNDQERETRRQQAARVLAQGMKGISDETLPKLLARKTLAGKPEVADRIRKMIDTTAPSGAAAALLGMGTRRDYSADLAGIEVPTLILVGREDSIRPVSDAEFMHRMIPNSRLQIIEDAAHVSNLDQPEIFNQALLGFLAAAWPS